MVWTLPPSDTYFARILEQTPSGFELDHLEFALKHVKRFRCAVDGGAHIGTWTVALARRFERVFAFEPAEDSFECLIENLRARDLTNAYPFKVALGSAAGVCTLTDDPIRKGNTGARYVDAVYQYGGTQMAPFDAFFRGEVDFLKLDVEGFELEALKGALGTIQRSSPVIMVECKQFKPTRCGGPELVVEYLTKLGYHSVGGVRNDRVFVRGE